MEGVLCEQPPSIQQTGSSHLAEQAVRQPVVWEPALVTPDVGTPATRCEAGGLPRERVTWVTRHLNGPFAWLARRASWRLPLRADAKGPPILKGVT